MKALKQLVYIPCNIRNRDCNYNSSYFYQERLFLLVGETPESGWYLGADEFFPYLTAAEKENTSWLKPQESFVFTEEELNEYVNDVIRATLEIAVPEMTVEDKEISLITVSQKFKV